MPEEINKAETSGSKTVVRPVTSREKGQPRIVSSGNFIDDTRKAELRMPRRLCTFENMMLDDAVFNSVDVTSLMISIAMSRGRFVAGPSNSSAAKEVAKFMNYNIRAMSFGTWMEYINNANTDIVNGFSLQNIVTEKRNSGPYKGFRVLRKLAPRSQKSVYGWVWDKNFRELQGFVQKPNLTKNRDPKMGDFNNGLNSINQAVNLNQNYPFIRSDQLTHFRYNPADNNPQGDSPLMHCYDAWVEKKLVERYEVVGVSKDLGGALVLRVPSQLIERANDPATYPDEAAEYNALQDDAAALHAGESTYIVLSSDVDPSTKVADYNIEFKGIDGGGKQYKTSDIIDQKRKSIYNVFGAGFLLLGQGTSGSYALSSSQTSTHGMYVQRDILWKTDVINNQLVTAILNANNIKLDWDDMPVFEPAGPDELDLDVLSKTVQRMKSVGGLTKEALTSIYEKAGLPVEGIDELSFDDGDVSRGGESNGTSGTGSSQSGGASSSTNSENGGTQKSLFIDGDKIVDSDTGSVVNFNDLNDNGEYK